MRAFALAIVMLATGCEKADEELQELEVERACSSYCELQATCDGDVDADSCAADCEDTVFDCPSEEIDAVVDDLDSCGEGTCDELGECEIGANLECYFGI